MQESGLLLRWELLLAHNLWVLIICLFFLLVILPSEIPRLATDPSERVFPGAWKLLSFYLLYFVLPPFEDNGLPFWVPDVLCQHSEVVLWNLLGVQMLFR